MKYYGQVIDPKDIVTKEYVDTKAPLVSPALTGTPTVPTAPAGTNNTQAASTAFTTGAVDGHNSAADAHASLLAGKSNTGHTHDDRYLHLTGGTLTGNLTGKHITGTWLQTTSVADLSRAAGKVAVLDDSGWVYYRTVAELLADLGIPDLPTGKKVARFVVGTSTAGWTAADCDYLCDGTADQTEINAAITALPATGGEIVILDGTYNITAKINVTKNNVSIRGSGNATILKRMFKSSVEEGVITLTGRSGCKIANLQVDGNKTSYTSSKNYGIYLSLSSNNTVTGNTCNNNSYGIHLNSSSNNTITSNTCNNNSRGIYLSTSSESNTVTGNTCNDNNDYGIYLNSSSNNTVTGNTCNNNSRGIYLSLSSNNTVTGNTCNNNSYGIYLSSSSNNTITSNTCIRGTGLATDYTESQHTIQLKGTGNNYNLIAMNNCMGKAVTNGGGTGNTLVNNKFDAT